MINDNVADTKIYLELDDELKKVLDDNELSISDILQNEGIEAHVMFGVTPYQTEDNARKKEPITIIIASSVLIISVALAISKVLNTLYNKPKVIKIYEPVELRDAKGNILMNKEGNPIFKKIEKYEILQPKFEERQEIKATFDPKNGIVIQISSETKANCNS